MLPKEKKMEVLEAFDLTKSYRAAGSWSEWTITPSPGQWPPVRSVLKSQSRRCVLEGGRGVHRQDRRVDRALRRPGPRRRGAREARGHGLHGL